MLGLRQASNLLWGEGKGKGGKEMALAGAGLWREYVRLGVACEGEGEGRGGTTASGQARDDADQRTDRCVATRSLGQPRDRDGSCGGRAGVPGQNHLVWNKWVSMKFQCHFNFNIKISMPVSMAKYA